MADQAITYSISRWKSTIAHKLHFFSVARRINYPYFMAKITIQEK